MINLFLTFLKIGAVSFGGGYGMISVITEEILSNGWLTESELLNFIAVSESTPGPISINMATFVGYSQFGFGGALLATLGVVLPAFLIILVVASLISGLLKYAGVQGVLSGIRPVVVGLIILTGFFVLIKCVFSIKTINDTFCFDYKSLIIFILVVLLSLIYKKIRKKNISSILLIMFSAVLGILFFGVL